MEWTLILTFSDGQSAAIENVPNFETEEAARIAGKAWKEQFHDIEQQSARFVVVKQTS